MCVPSDDLGDKSSFDPSFPVLTILILVFPNMLFSAAKSFSESKDPPNCLGLAIPEKVPSGRLCLRNESLEVILIFSSLEAVSVGVELLEWDPWRRSNEFTRLIGVCDWAFDGAASKDAFRDEEFRLDPGGLGGSDCGGIEFLKGTGPRRPVGQAGSDEVSNEDGAVEFELELLKLLLLRLNGPGLLP